MNYFTCKKPEKQAYVISLDSKGRLVLPCALRNLLGVGPGARIFLEYLESKKGVLSISVSAYSDGELALLPSSRNCSEPAGFSEPLSSDEKKILQWKAARTVAFSKSFPGGRRG